MTTISTELELQRPQTPAGLLSRAEKDRLIERGMVGIYRWYFDQSQSKRNWNPYRSFDWANFRTDHSPDMISILERFLAVEQYVPDYTSKLTQLTRRSLGRSHFQILWGAEEAKHAELWYNTLLFSKARSAKWIADFVHNLRQQEWKLPWDDALHMSCYVVIQERATQLNYLKTVQIATGRSDKSAVANDQDPVLAQAAQIIANDEAAHYGFFLSIASLYLYYYPAQLLAALEDVIKNFAMPALDLFEDPNWGEVLYRTGIYGPREYTRDVLQAALKQLNIHSRKALELGIRNSRQVPDPDGNLCDSAIFDAFDYQAVERNVKNTIERATRYAQEVGIADLDPILFTPSGLAPTA
jgi:acyl-[acyl-carrier-protein] desaturase